MKKLDWSYDGNASDPKELLPCASLSQPPMSSSGLLADLTAPVERLKELRRSLQHTRAEIDRLEALHVARADVKAQIEMLEDETRAAKEEQQAIGKKIVTIEQQKQQIEERRADEVARGQNKSRAPELDAEAQAKIVDRLRRRNQHLSRLHSTLKDPAAMLKEEEGLRALEATWKALDRERHDHVRELAHRTKQIDLRQAQLEKERGSASVSAESTEATEDREDGGQAYLQRLEQLAQGTRGAHDKAASNATQLQQAWDFYLALFAGCARTLRARADAGNENASELMATMDGGEGGDERARPSATEFSTPAFRVLEVVSKLTTQSAALRKRLRDGEEKEVALEQRLRSLRVKVVAQSAALKMQSDAALKRAVVAERKAAAASRLAHQKFTSRDGQFGAQIDPAIGSTHDSGFSQRPPDADESSIS